MLCSNATILRARSDPRWDIAGVMQPSENLKKLDGSYLTLPPEALIFRKMGANVFMDAALLAPRCETHYPEPAWPWAPPWSLPRHRLGRSQSSLTSR